MAAGRLDVKIGLTQEDLRKIDGRRDQVQLAAMTDGPMEPAMMSIMVSPSVPYVDNTVLESVCAVTV